jgi:hypothetical protein
MEYKIGMTLLAVWTTAFFYAMFFMNIDEKPKLRRPMIRRDRQ